ncbi:hypothetical protein PHLGIDRAFT_127618 [Phlebiopsis gigantea 11061_1 CR5-6]|uniref:Uncharacterized protein n=1 Tax=Phlebiopsis gigantea (strain 11061_1 CR5-6) TaxID=745531 RepID=A0A0C3RZ17_PHLG1|nr:hypothetical protein PHLGIDRAFT_127618 [Phlebiopsis gigantea 11061_1 CR5-6]
MAIITISSSAPHILVMWVVYLGGYRGMSTIIGTLAALAYVALFGSLGFAYRSNYPFDVSLAFITNVQLLVWPLPCLVVFMSHARYAMGWRGHTLPVLLQSVLNTYAVGYMMEAMLWNIMTVFVLFDMQLKGQRPLAWLITLEFVANAQIALTFKLLDVYHKNAAALPTIWGDKESLSAKEVIPIT